MSTDDEDTYDVVIVGTGFASTFFLGEYLRLAPPTARVFVLERGRRGHGPAHPARAGDVDFERLLVNRTPKKAWVQRFGFGGGTCWTGNTPRLHPHDFETRSRYGVGEDWPIGYDDLEPYYVEVERRMGVAGAAGGPYPRSAPYPAPAHPFNALDRALAAKYPGLHVPMPSARSSDPERTGRATCCVNGVCSTCPLLAKFRVDLHYASPYDDPRVRLLTESPAERVDVQAGRVTGVVYTRARRERRARCDLAALGAHAIMTPWLLLRSGLDDAALGRYLNEQIAVDVQVDLHELDNYDGGQAVTGLGLPFYDDASRATLAGCLVENWNVPWLRAEAGRWRWRGFLKFVFEDVPEASKRVELAGSDGARPAVTYARHSDYLARGLAALPARIEAYLEGLPVEGFHVLPAADLGGSAHIQGTTRMGVDPATSVVDADLRHHRVRNLLALGSGTFPTCPAANPTLTLCALSVRAARRLFSAAA